MKKLFLLISLSCTLAFGSAQDEWKHYSFENGSLPENHCYGLLVDTSNSVWVGTHKGVSFNDGTGWKHYTTTDGLTSNKVSCIEQDKDGKIWVGSHFNSLSRFNGSTWDSIPSATNVYCLKNTGDALWVGTNAGLDIYDGSTWTSKNDLGGFVYAIEKGFNSDVWCCVGNNKLMRFDGLNWINHSEKDSSILKGKEIQKIFRDDASGNMVCIGFFKGFLKYDGQNWKLIDRLYNDTEGREQQVSYIWDMCIDQKGNYWMDCDGGFMRSDGESHWMNTDNPYTNRTVAASRVDRMGTKWLATESEGLFSFGGYNWKSFNLTAFVYEDINENSQKDPSEPFLSNQPIGWNNSTWLTNDNGYFRIIAYEAINTFRSLPLKNWHSTSDSIVVLDLSTGIDSVYFGIKPDYPINDMKVVSSPGPLRPGFSGNIWFNALNEGTTHQSGNMSITISTKCSVESIEPTPHSSSGNTFTWNFGNLLPQERLAIKVQVKVPDTTAIGDTIVCSSQVKGNNPEITIEDNTIIMPITVRGSFDPNDKTVFPEGKTDQHYVLKNSPLTYTIRFQNKGTDTAFRVIVKDTLDTSLDWSTLKILASSHAMITQWAQGGVLTFLFKDILLPDDKINEPASHGYIQYIVYPKTTVPENTLVKNTAHIFFDFNKPVTTNTTENTLVSMFPSAVLEHGGINTLELSPNPANNWVNISVPLSTAKSYRLVLSDLQGKCLKEEWITGTYLLNIGDFPSGLYFLNLLDPESGKIFKNKLAIQR